MRMTEMFPDNHEQRGDRPGRITRMFGNLAIWRVEAGATKVTLNPILGLGAYLPDTIIDYTQGRLRERGFATHIEQDLIESGSETQIPRDRLVVDARPE